MSYRVNDIYPTLHSTGYLHGTPVVVVRLQGCAVGCPYCDQRVAWATSAVNRRTTMEAALGPDPGWCEASALEIVEKCVRLARGTTRWALVTGGEPLAQDCTELTLALRAAGLLTAVETSGVYAITGKWSWVTVSPKLGMPGIKSGVLPSVVASASELKWIVAGPADVDAFARFIDNGMHRNTCALSVQPIHRNERAARICVDECIRRGWRLSLPHEPRLGLK